jgi:N-succinyldiaminopimelate aminotransferase
VSVLPGSFIARDTLAGNPGRGYIRIALVASLSECSEAVDRMLQFATVSA